jgi:hypothetical protein
VGGVGGVEWQGGLTGSDRWRWELQGHGQHVIRVSNLAHLVISLGRTIDKCAVLEVHGSRSKRSTG